LVVEIHIDMHIVGDKMGLVQYINLGQLLIFGILSVLVLVFALDNIEN